MNKRMDKEKPMNIDDRIGRILGSALTIGGAEVFRVTNPQEIKQLIADVIKEIVPEQDPVSEFASGMGRNAVISEIEAKAKELGL